MSDKPAYPTSLDKMMDFIFEQLDAKLDKVETLVKESQFAIRRQRGLNDIAFVIEETYGARCDRNEGGCQRCTAWAVFDCIERLTDATR